jgi:hypothetical protein
MLLVAPRSSNVCRWKALGAQVLRTIAVKARAKKGFCGGTRSARPQPHRFSVDFGTAAREDSLKFEATKSTEANPRSTEIVFW